jgi:hypothetical protein
VPNKAGADPPHGRAGPAVDTRWRRIDGKRGGGADHYRDALEGSDCLPLADAAAARRAARRGFSLTSSTMAAIESTTPAPPATVVTALG